MSGAGQPAVAAWQWLVAVFFFGLIVLLCRLSPGVNKSPEAGVKSALPDTVGDLQGGETQGMSDLEKNVLPADTEMIRRVYTGPRGDALACTIVLAGGQKNSIHRPEVCLPAQGWVIDRQEQEQVTLASGRTLPVMNVAVHWKNERDRRAYYMYWFVGKNVNTASHWTRVFLSSRDRVFRNVNHRWAYVSVFMPVTPPRTGEQVTAMMREFIAKSAPEYIYSEMAPAQK